MGVYEFREKVVAVLRAAAALECRCDPPFSACVACQAAGVLHEVAEIGLRMQRWRNGLGTVVVTVHIAGQVWVSREYRRSCPGYIVDRRQACALCGIELARGKWGMFFDPGDRVWIRPDPPGLERDRGPELAGLPRHPGWLLDQTAHGSVMCSEVDPLDL